MSLLPRRMLFGNTSPAGFVSPEPGSCSGMHTYLPGSGHQNRRLMAIGCVVQCWALRQLSELLPWPRAMGECQVHRDVDGAVAIPRSIEWEGLTWRTR